MRVAISACLLGEPCRYDGRAKPHEGVIEFARGHDVLPVCPEVAGGLPTPRLPSEQVTCTESDGIRIDGRTVRVASRDGADVTKAFELGARTTLSAAREFGCEAAILKANSPSCGSGCVYDGSFTGTLTEGWGVAAVLLRDAGIPVCSEKFDPQDLLRSRERQSGV